MHYVSFFILDLGLWTHREFFAMHSTLKSDPKQYLVLSVAANQFMKRVQGFRGNRGTGMSKILVGTALCAGINYSPPLFLLIDSPKIDGDQSSRPNTFRWSWE